MEYRSFCDNKGCKKEMRPVVNKETLEAFCTECGKSVNNISIFMRRQMRDGDQVQRNEKKRMAWAIKCNHCQKEGSPELDKTGEALVCASCKKVLNQLAKPFAQMIMVNLKAQRRANGE